MEHTGKELAAVTGAKAYQIGDSLLVRITGQKPDGCHVIALERSLLTVEPPAFIATWHVPPGVRCILIPVDYEYQEVFDVGIMRDTVILHHAGGEMAVEVEELSPGVKGMVLPADQGFSEAVGYSNAFDFDEAFRHAISQIPIPPIPDWLATFEVLDIGAEIGGIIGVNRLVVRVRGG
ncbi:MAG: hypothetical protein ACR2HV_11445 [Acidimicrobiales bacterium]